MVYIVKYISCTNLVSPSIIFMEDLPEWKQYHIALQKFQDCFK